MLTIQEGKNIFFPIFLGDYGDHSEGVTGKSTSELNVYATDHGASPISASDITSICTLHEADSSNNPGLYVLEIDNVGSPGLDWSAGTDGTISFECSETVPTFRDPPPQMVVVVAQDPTDLAASIWEALDSAYPDVSPQTKGGALARILSLVETYLDTAISSRAAPNDAMDLISGAIVQTTFNAGAIDNNAIAANAIGASELATDAVEEIRDAILDDATRFSGADIGSILTQVQSNSSDIADVQDEVDRPIPILQLIGPPIAYTTMTNARFAAIVYDAKTGNVIGSAKLSGGTYFLRQWPEAGGSSFTSGSPSVSNGIVYIDVNFASGWAEGDVYEVEFRNIDYTDDTATPARTYNLTQGDPVAKITGKLLSEPGSGTGGGGATAAEVWGYDTTGLTGTVSAGARLNQVSDLVPRIRQVVVEIARFFGIQLGANS